MQHDQHVFNLAFGITRRDGLVGKSNSSILCAKSGLVIVIVGIMFILICIIATQEYIITTCFRTFHHYKRQHSLYP